MQPTPGKPAPDRLTLILRGLLATVLLALALAGAMAALAFVTTPAAIRQPTQVHEHLRLQIITGGQPVNFGAAPFQTDFNKDMCTAALTKEPIHFHDGLDQFLHLHWAGMTGGLLLKHYGWNLVGGLPGLLGYRFDDLPWLQAVPVHGQALPALPANSAFYIYTGTAAQHQERSWTDFLLQDLHTFLGGSPVTATQGAELPHAGHGQEDLVRINHVIGNIVIFVQDQKPSEDQIMARFNALTPLPESSCGG
jgi:hypothetical protein